MNEFKMIMDLITPYLQGKKFIRRGNSFYLQEYDNYCLLNFQKSVKSTKSVTEFTLNIGIRSKILSNFLGEELKDSKFTISDCHWTARVGSLMGTNNDFWWHIEDGDSIENAAIDIVQALKQFVIPAIEIRISDNGLLTEWLNGKYGGTSELNLYIYLTILLKAANNSELSEYIEKLITYTNKRSVNFNLLKHLERLDDIEEFKR